MEVVANSMYAAARQTVQAIVMARTVVEVCARIAARCRTYVSTIFAAHRPVLANVVERRMNAWEFVNLVQQTLCARIKVVKHAGILISLAVL